MRSRLHAFASIARNGTRNLSHPLLERSGLLTSLSPKSSVRRVPKLVWSHHRYVSSKACTALHDISEKSEENTPLVFHSTSTDPYHNLSIEDYLLRNSHPTSRILLFYTNRPCVVIGRNQNPWLECDIKRLQKGLPGRESSSAPTTIANSPNDCQNVPIDLVRRRSGGGTVFHDLGNLNYSIIVPNDKDFNRRTHAEMVVRGLNKVTSYDLSATIKVNDRHDIVMQRHGDLGWLKISGSAFKLIKGRALHHGTLLHSSPHLQQIAALLRSPGQDFIHAKGVESVRSKVGNLVTTGSQQESDALSKVIVDKVMQEFLTMYGHGRSDITSNKPFEVSDEDCRNAVNAAIAAGVKELRGNDWRFGQTPKFDFNSGQINGFQLAFNANRGLLETLRVESRDAERGVELEGSLKEPLVLNSIRDWKSTLESIPLRSVDGSQGSPNLQEVSQNLGRSEALLGRMAVIFPFYGA